MDEPIPAAHPAAPLRPRAHLRLAASRCQSSRQPRPRSAARKTHPPRGRERNLATAGRSANTAGANPASTPNPNPSSASSPLFSPDMSPLPQNNAARGNLQTRTPALSQPSPMNFPALPIDRRKTRVPPRTGELCPPSRINPRPGGRSSLATSVDPGNGPCPGTQRANRRPPRPPSVTGRSLLETLSAKKTFVLMTL